MTAIAEAGGRSTSTFQVASARATNGPGHVGITSNRLAATSSAAIPGQPAVPGQPYLPGRSAGRHAQFDLDYPGHGPARATSYLPRAGAYRALRHSVDDDELLVSWARAACPGPGRGADARVQVEFQVRRPVVFAWSTTWVAASCCSTATAASASCCCACIRRCARPGRRHR